MAEGKSNTRASGGAAAGSIFAEHSRNWKDNLYVYPVISRRSKGLSIGVNLNPDKACNFDCIYCQVDRGTPPKVRKVDMATLESELAHMLQIAASGVLFDDVRFGQVPAELRRINDVAFSGDGEPTTSPQFPAAVQLAADLIHKHQLIDTKLIVLTDGCYLTKPEVALALEIMDRHNGEIWAKLDAGTQDYYELINKPSHPLQHVIDNITAAARLRAIVIQALFMRVRGKPPPQSEIDAFCERLNEIVARSGRIKLVQVYTIARQPAQSFVTPLAADELETIGAAVQNQTDLPVELYHGITD